MSKRLPAVLRALAALLLVCWPWVSHAKPLTIVVISDLNGSYGSTDYAPRISRAIDWIIKTQPDLVISTGDMVAGQRIPVLSDAHVRRMWTAFHETVSDPLARAGIPLAVTPGNHDASGYERFIAERRIYAEQWKDRKPALNFIDDAGYPLFYVFDIGGVRFASLDATTLGPLRGDQHARLKSALSASDTAVTFSHLPLFPFAIDREKEIIGDPTLENLYHELGVDLHLSGHHHAFWPGYKDGVAYVSQACLGGGPRALIGTRERTFHGLTILTISENGEFAIEARRGPDYEKAIDVRSLPRKIGGLTRLDLAR